MQSPIGTLTISAEDDAIVALDWGWGRDQEKMPLLEDAVAQLNDYFDGRRRAFALPLQPAATPFAAAFRDATAAIPYGTTVGYGTVAAGMGATRAAVSRASRTNPIPVIVPCHRLVGARGLGEHVSGDPDIKRFLIALEQEYDSVQPDRPEA